VANPSEHEDKLIPVNYFLDGDNLLQFHGVVKEAPAEVWFQNDDLDGISVPMMILNVLASCPMDTRVPLASSILLTGGLCILPGIQGRLIKELTSLLKNIDKFPDPVVKGKLTNAQEHYEFKIFEAPVLSNHLGWLGGAIYGATEIMNTRGYAKEQFLKNGKVPDWSDYYLTTPSKSQHG